MKIPLVEPETLKQAVISAKDSLQHLRDKKKKSRADFLSMEYLRTFINKRKS